MQSYNTNYNQNVKQEKLNNYYENGVNNHSNQVPNGLQQSIFSNPNQPQPQQQPPQQQQYYNNFQPISQSLPPVNSHLNQNPVYGTSQTHSTLHSIPSSTVPTINSTPIQKQFSLNSSTNAPNSQYLSSIRPPTQQHLSSEPAILRTNGQQSMPSIPSIPVSTVPLRPSYPSAQPVLQPPQPQPPPPPQQFHSQQINHNSNYGPNVTQLQRPVIPPAPMPSYTRNAQSAVPPPPIRSTDPSMIKTQPIHTPVYNGINYSPGQQSIDQITNKMGGMSVQQSWEQMWSHEGVNLMTEKDIRTKAIISEQQKVANSSNEADTNCSKDIMRCTLTKVPDSASLLQKARLPFGILIHPFKDDDVSIDNSSSHIYYNSN